MTDEGMVSHLERIRDLLITGEQNDAYNARIKVQLLIDELNTGIMEHRRRGEYGSMLGVVN
jgi:hypothetical protein